MKSNSQVKKKKEPNKSKFNFSPKLLKVLHGIQENGGTVTYVFIEERISFKEDPLGVVFNKKSNLVAPINPDSFFKDSNGRVIRKSIPEIMEMFEDTRDDMGASYFIIS